MRKVSKGNRRPNCRARQLRQIDIKFRQEGKVSCWWEGKEKGVMALERTVTRGCDQ